MNPITRYNLTERELAIIALALAGGFVVGLWAGLWMLPAEALDVPTHERDSGGQTTYSPAFYPVPTSYFTATLLVPLAAAWYAHVKTRDDPNELEAEAIEAAAATDGGTDRKEATDADVQEEVPK